MALGVELNAYSSASNKHHTLHSKYNNTSPPCLLLQFLLLFLPLKPTRATTLYTHAPLLMGCTASKLENEDTVRRCKDRRRLMKEAVYARHHLAAAHSDYCRSLRLTGTALSTFASGEPLSVSDNTPAVFINHKTTIPTTATTTTTFHRPPPSSHIPSPSPSSYHHHHHTPPPPPQQQPFNPSPSPTIATSKLPHILSSSTTSSTNHHPRRRKQPPPKLPHILSDSSPSSTPRSNASNNFASNFFPTAHSTYSSTPSQTSSVWNWENFYPPPPPPPGSDYFDRDKEDAASQFSFKSRNTEVSHSRQQPQQQQQQQPQKQQQQPQTYQQLQQHQHQHQQQHYLNPTAHEVEGFDSERSEYDYFNGKLATVQKNHSNHHLEEYTETEREEVECSEWGDHYSTTSSSEDDDEDEDGDDGVDGDVESRSEIGTRSNFGSSSAVRKGYSEKGYGEAVGKSEDLASSSTGEGVMEMKMVVRHRDLKEIVDSIKENFDKAAVAGDKVSEMLEISKAQLDRSFRQLRSE